MKAFQIFDRETPPPEPYLGFMRDIADMSESYTLIAKADFMGRDFVDYDSVFSMLPKNLQANPGSWYGHYDAMRCLYLCENFDHAYFDIDMELHHPIEIKSIPQKNSPGLLVGNGDAALGRQCWQDYLAVCHSCCRTAGLIFRNTPHEMIPETAFTHHHANGKYKEVLCQ